MMIPAVQSAREAARRMQCANNLRNLAVAVSTYESVNRTYPLAYKRKPKHNFVQFILPYMDEQALYDLYDFKQDWDSEHNRPVTDSEIDLLRCPSAPREYSFVSDYAVCVHVGKELAEYLLDEELIRERSDLTGLLRVRVVKASKITDGLSNTILFSETSGRPDIYVLGRLKKANTLLGSRWATDEARFDLEKRCDGIKLKQGTQLINCTSNDEIYSFHDLGANFAFADGSARFIFKDVDPDVLISYITAAAGD